MDIEIPNDLTLAHGSHETREQGMCAMEAVAWLAGEEHSDSPACTCPAIARFVIRCNDRWPDADRQRLVPLLPILIGTRDPAKLVPRAYMAADWAVREIQPQWLDLAGFPEQAAELRALAAITDRDSARAGSEASRRARGEVLKKYPDDAADAAADAAAADRTKIDALVAAQRDSTLEIIERMARL